MSHSEFPHEIIVDLHKQTPSLAHCADIQRFVPAGTEWNVERTLRHSHGCDWSNNAWGNGDGYFRQHSSSEDYGDRSRWSLSLPAVKCRDLQNLCASSWLRSNCAGSDLYRRSAASELQAGD